MSDIFTIVTMILGLFIRIGIPIGVTALFVWWLRRLDIQWQKEGERELSVRAVTRKQPGNSGCWKVNNCSPEQRAACRAYAHPESPCWQVYRSEDGLLREQCLICQVFREAPVPVAT